MNTQEDYPGFMTMEEDVAEEDENIIIDGYLDYSSYTIVKRSVEIEI